MPDPYVATLATIGLGWVAAARGDRLGAVRLYASVSSGELIDGVGSNERAQYEFDVDALRSELDATSFDTAWAEGVRSPPIPDRHNRHTTP